MGSDAEAGTEGALAVEARLVRQVEPLLDWVQVHAPPCLAHLSVRAWCVRGARVVRAWQMHGSFIGAAWEVHGRVDARCTRRRAARTCEMCAAPPPMPAGPSCTLRYAPMPEVSRNAVSEWGCS